MTDEELMAQVKQELTPLRERDVILETDIVGAIRILTSLQLVLRHPDISREHRTFIHDFANCIYQEISTVVGPASRELLQRGFSSGAPPTQTD